jgi:hypothetical protein
LDLHPVLNVALAPVLLLLHFPPLQALRLLLQLQQQKASGQRLRQAVSLLLLLLTTALLLLLLLRTALLLLLLPAMFVRAVWVRMPPSQRAWHALTCAARVRVCQALIPTHPTHARLHPIAQSLLTALWCVSG